MLRQVHKMQDLLSSFLVEAWVLELNGQLGSIRLTEPESTPIKAHYG